MERAKAVNEAIASLEMEGFQFTDEELVIFEKLAKGEMSYAEVRKFFDEQLKRLQIEKPECFAKEI